MDFMTASPKKIGILGAGAFGSSLGEAFLRAGQRVEFWARSAEIVNEINSQNTNTRYKVKKGFFAPAKACLSKQELLKNNDLIVYACPSSHFRSICQELKEGWQKERHVLINSAKGLDLEEKKLHSTVFNEVLPQSHYQILSGPSFAQEILEEQPTCVTIAGINSDKLIETQKSISHPTFRPYRSQDVIGVEIGGAVKNVIAIIAGFVEGFGYGYNTKAAMINKGLREMTELGLKLGADPKTFLGLSGMGDLVLTCTGKLSRNRSFGVYLGQGLSKEEAQNKVNSTIEGIHTTKAVKEIADRLEIKLTLCNEVYQVLYESKSPEKAIQDLLARPIHEEWAKSKHS